MCAVEDTIDYCIINFIFCRYSEYAEEHCDWNNSSNHNYGTPIPRFVTIIYLFTRVR